MAYGFEEVDEVTTTLTKTISNAASNRWALSGSQSVNFESSCDVRVERNLFKDLKLRQRGVGTKDRQETKESINIINDFKLIVMGFTLTGTMTDIPSGDSAATRANRVMAMAESGVKAGGLAVFTYGGSSYNVEFKQVKFIEFSGQPTKLDFVIELVVGEVRVQ